MTTELVFTPPKSDLIRQWMEKAGVYQQEEWYYEANLAIQAAEWGYQQGADAELNECCDWLTEGWDEIRAEKLRAARRPKPPSLKEQALDELDGIAAVFRMFHGGDLVCDTIRRALEQLND